MHQGYEGKVPFVTDIDAGAVDSARFKASGKPKKSLRDVVVILLVGTPALLLLGWILWGLWQNGHLG